MSFRLGQLNLRNHFILSPLESVSDVGFRKLCFRNGAAFTWTEMVRSQAISRGNKAALDLIDTFDEDTPTGVQLLAKSADGLLKSLHQLENLSSNGKRPHFRNISAIDLNFGCPSLDVIREGAGPALLSRSKRMQEILSTLVSWKNHPANCLKIGAVGCKIRLGLNQSEQQHKVYLRVAHIANEVELDYITVHARHAKQKSSDAPTWSAIREVKEVATMPVIANGNVTDLRDVAALHRETNCDGFMVARAAIRNPWVFALLGADVAAPADAADDEQESAAKGGGDLNRHRRSDHYLSWPTPSQVEAARADYFRATEQVSDREKEHERGAGATIRAKYRQFHEANFRRLLAASRDPALRTAPFRPPRTAHL